MNVKKVKPSIVENINSQSLNGYVINISLRSTKVYIISLLLIHSTIMFCQFFMNY